MLHIQYLCRCLPYAVGLQDKATVGRLGAGGCVSLRAVGSGGHRGRAAVFGAQFCLSGLSRCRSCGCCLSWAPRCCRGSRGSLWRSPSPWTGPGWTGPCRRSLPENSSKMLVSSLHSPRVMFVRFVYILSRIKTERRISRDYLPLMKNHDDL